jgi:hypothetical protein
MPSWPRHFHFHTYELGDETLSHSCQAYRDVYIGRMMLGRSDQYSGRVFNPWGLSFVRKLVSRYRRVEARVIAIIDRTSPRAGT